MSLRGSETTEAISEHFDKSEIPTLPRIECGVARNGKRGIVIVPKEERKGKNASFATKSVSFLLEEYFRKGIKNE